MALSDTTVRLARAKGKDYTLNEGKTRNGNL
jgi:hypothetical protein